MKRETRIVLTTVLAAAAVVSFGSWQVVAQLHGDAALPADAWRRELEAEVLAQMPPIEAFSTAAEIATAYERRGDFILNPKLAYEKDQRARELGRGTEPVPFK